MKKILIIPNQFKDKNFIITLRVIDWLISHDLTPLLPMEYGDNEQLRVFCIKNKQELTTVDYGLVLGGDGTIIRTSRIYLDYDIPLLGINMGNLGFLAEIELVNLNAALESVFEQNFIIEERMLIQSCHENGQLLGVALNDIVITRQSISRMISFDIYVNDCFVNNYRADGVIISTPTGSTAYNLSAGGPIISPNNEVIVLTPICPHSLTARSIVLSGNDVIKITFDHPKNNHVDDLLITIDGQEVTRIYKKDTIIVKKSLKKVQLVRMKDNNFFDILRRKLS